MSFNLKPLFITLVSLNSLCFSTYSLKLVEYKTLSPLAEVDVLLLKSVTTLQTDQKGVIIIPKQEVSNHQIALVILSPHIAYRETTLTLTPHQITTHQVKISKKKIKQFRDLNLHAKSKTTSQQFISREKLADNLQVNFNDVVKTLQTQPGVSSSGSSIDSALFIQGGSGEEWIGIFDNIYILTPSRWGGAVTMFNPLVIDNINFYTGGFPAYYVNGLSGVLEVSLLSPDRQRWKFYGNLDNGLEAMAHGPMGKHSGALIQVRRTWIDFLQTFFPNASIFTEGGGGDGIVQAPYILDGLIKFKFDLSPATSLSTLFYLSQEGLDLDLNQVATRVADPNQNDNETRFSYQENNFIAALTVEHQFSSFDILKTTLGYTPRFLEYRQNDNGIREVDNTLTSHSYQLGVNHTHGSLPNHNLRVGGLAYFYRGAINFNETRYFINSQTNYTVEPRNIDATPNRILFNVHATDDWLLAKYLVMQYGLNMNFRTGSEEFFIGPRLGFELILNRQAAIHVRTGLYNFHDFDYLKIHTTPDFQSQKSYHLVTGTKFQIKRLRFLGEAFYKNYWDLLERRPDGGYENTGVRQVGGFALNLELNRNPRSLFSGYISYTFQQAVETITSRSPATTDSFEVSQIRQLPPVGEGFTPTYLRDHTLALYFKLTPFKRLQTKRLKPASGWVNNQYLSAEFAFLSSKPETSVTSVIKTTNEQGESKFLLQRDDFNNTTTPPIIKLNIQYGIPVNDNIDVFITFVNVLNYQNVLYYDYTITPEFAAGRDDLETYPYQSYGEKVIREVPNIDTRFTVRGGLRLRY